MLSNIFYLQKKTVNILHLDGRRLEVECDPSKTRVNQLTQVDDETDLSLAEEC